MKRPASPRISHTDSGGSAGEVDGGIRFRLLFLSRSHGHADGGYYGRSNDGAHERCDYAISIHVYLQII
jgi:hypothetical protein